MDTVRFVLVAEGSAEGELIPHLRRLCVEAGARQAIGTFPDLSRLPSPPGRSVEAKVTAVLELDDHIDVIFVHKDADARDPTVARHEIGRGTVGIPAPMRAVAVVPIQELEAWLLVDPQAIREVVGKPNSRAALGIPGRVESAANPKEILQRALMTASEARGRRRGTVRKSFGAHRRTLLARLDIHGPVRTLAAWRQLEADIQATITSLATHAAP